MTINDMVRFDFVACGRVRTAEGRIVRVLNPGEVPGEVIKREFSQYRVASNDYRPVKEIRYLVLVDGRTIYFPRPHMMRNAEKAGINNAGKS